MFRYRSSNTKEFDLLGQILAQSESLRNTILENILKKDPLYSSNSSLRKSNCVSQEQNAVALSLQEKHKLIAYLKGESMTPIEEKQVLETFKSMTSSDICELTAHSFNVTQSNCHCCTCKSYSALVKHAKSIPPNHKHSLQYIDSLRVTVHSLMLSNEGKMKCVQHYSAKKNIANGTKSQFSQLSKRLTYLIEYEIPPSLQKLVKRKAKVDSGLNLGNRVKLSSNNIINDVVYFKQTSLHDIANLETINTSDMEIHLRVSCRGVQGMRKVVALGCGKFNFHELLNSNSQYTNDQKIAIFPKLNSPFIVGRVKMRLQLGYNKTHFGKDYLDSFQNSNDNEVISVDSGDILITNDNSTKMSRNVISRKKSTGTQTETQKSFIAIPHVPEKDLTLPIELKQRTIVFGFIFVAQVHYVHQYEATYFSCQPFCQHDFIRSNVTNAPRNYFDFHQTIPYICDESFVFRLRDNHMIFEFFAKNCDDAQSDEVVGIAKVSLHQYYLAFRNPTIVEYLSRNKLPVIGSDWYEPIIDPITNRLKGNAQILVALGSELQIHNLKKDRGFMDDVVRRTNTSYDSKLSNTIKTRQLSKIHKTLPFDNLNTRIEAQNKQMDENNQGDNRIEAIQDYLPQLIVMKNEEKHVENSENLNATHTITENETMPCATSTSELLESLQNAVGSETQKKDSFKVQIVIESALHLPARKKCRVRKVKGKVVREELWPSTYVSYELRDGNVKTTTVVQKSTSPTWNMKSDGFLSLDYLKNSDRQLLFKVWKKSNNGSTIPNMQIDTIIGFAALDLTVLLAGLPSIEGWFNIMDLANKCNGQIKINVTPLENLSKYNIPLPRSTIDVDAGNVIESSSYTTPPCDLLPFGDYLSRAMKRKFTELEDISQRLKTRLNDVTEELSDDTDTCNDDIADEFEKDINTLCVEEDYDLLDFTKAAQDLNMQRVSCSLQKWQAEKCDVEITANDSHADSSSALALQFSVPIEHPFPDVNVTSSQSTVSTSVAEASGLSMVEGKERIDLLLQKLSLISKNDSSGTSGFSSRHVSGCSANCANAAISFDNIDEDLLREFGINGYNKVFDNFLPVCKCTKDVRDAPDGEGNICSEYRDSAK